MQSQKFNKNVNWNVKETYFNLHIKLYSCIWLNKMQPVEVPSSPNSPPLFVIVFWGETNRDSLSQMFFRIGVLKNFANFIGKHQCSSIFSIKLQAWTLLTRDSIFLRTPSFTEHLQWLFLNKPRRSLWFIVWRSDALVI